MMIVTNSEYLKQYCHDVLNGDIVAGKKVVRQCEILWEMLNGVNIFDVRNDENEIEPREYIFDLKKANRIIDFKEKYCHINHRGKKQLMQMYLAQKASDQAAFGFVDKETRLRLHNERFMVVGRKNGKTVDRAATGNYMMLADGEYAAQCACVANSHKQAMLLFTPAARMVKSSPMLSARIKKRKYDLYCEKYESSFIALASAQNSLDGYELHYGINDECHASKNRQTYDDLVQSTSTRQQALIDIITTNGFVREFLFDDLYYTASDELFNPDFFNPRKLKLIYELDDKEEINNPQMWVKANPSLGFLKSFQYIEDKIKEAKGNPAFMLTVLTKDFNIPQASSASWLSWDDIVNETVADMEYLRNSYAIGGCDLSATTDLTCSTLLIRKKGDPKAYILQHYFIPETKLKLQQAARSQEAPYEKWQKQGWLTICKGSQVDYSQVTNWFVRMVTQHNIRPIKVCYDRALAGYWVPEMEGVGFEMEKIAQGPFTWSQPMKEMGAALTDKSVVYQNNPILRWCLTNTAAKALNSDGIQTVQPVKIAANKRIDGTVSMLNAWVGYNKNFDEYMSYVQNTTM